MEEAAFFVGTAPKVCNEDLTQLELELKESRNLAVAE
jgi:hypothetical protein